MTTRHSLPIKYDPETKTYSGELRITKTPSFLRSWEVERKHEQVETWPDGKVKVIKHHYHETLHETRKPIRGTRAWKESRKRK